MRHLLVPLFAGAAILACDDLDTPKDVDCPAERGPFELGAGRVSGTLAFDPIDKPLSQGDVLVVHGTAHHEDGLAIREVRIAGVAATRDEFNFQAFTAEVPYQKIAAAGPLSAQAQITFEAAAIDACGNRYPFASATVDVDPTPTIAVDELAMTVVYPGDRTFLPTDGTTPALVTITASGRALGAVVRVQASSGTLANVGPSGDVTLSAPLGTTDSASATVLVYGTEPGTITLTAVVENQLASALVEVAGPPTLSPAAATLVPGESLAVAVDASGEVRCRADHDDDLVVTSDGAPIDGELVAIGGPLTITAVAEPTGSGVTVVVTCQDPYGQSASGRYTLTVEAPEDPGEEPPDGGF